MRGDGAGGCVGGGCSGLSLIGLLVGVGLTVWLGSMVADGMFGGDGPKPRDAASLASVIESSTTVPATASIVVDPAADLVDGQRVVITSDAFPAEGAVQVDSCLARTTVATGDSACDPTATALDPVDARGHLVARYDVHRVVTVGGTPYDCASQAGLCVLRVTAVGQEDPIGSAPLTFRADDDRPEITLPD
ncbi:MAG: hypothetical protein KF703_15755 [Actinobacteria bacterium]|nr:hypothetical protein [Actinomycetota bacterium]